MGKLRVITVPPEYLPNEDRADGFAVVLGDLILPGHYLGRYPDAESADTACNYFAAHYGLDSYPLTSRRGDRPTLRLIRGGANGRPVSLPNPPPLPKDEPDPFEDPES